MDVDCIVRLFGGDCVDLCFLSRGSSIGIESDRFRLVDCIARLFLGDCVDLCFLFRGSSIGVESDRFRLVLFECICCWIVNDDNGVGWKCIMLA